MRRITITSTQVAAGALWLLTTALLGAATALHFDDQASDTAWLVGWAMVALGLAILGTTRAMLDGLHQRMLDDVALMHRERDARAAALMPQQRGLTVLRHAGRN